MARTLEIETDGTTAVVVRRATGAADVEQLRRTADRLAAASHPGVVEVVSSEGDREAWEVRLVHAGRPADVVGRLSAERVAAIAASVAATLADLHAIGIVHGRLDASHVLLGAHGRPVLCGFGPAPDDGVGPEDDVGAVGSLMVALLGTDADLDPIPARRWLRSDGQSWVRRSLLLLADHACAEPATRRPSAQRLAAAIAETVPLVPALSSDSPSGSHSVVPSAAGRRTVLVASALAALVLGGVALRQPSPAESPPAEIAHAATTISPTTTISPATTIVPTTTILPTTTARRPDTTSAARLVPPTITFDGRRYEIGRPGDLAVLGDWDGDLTPTPALLRPSTGEVFVFPQWTLGADLVIDATVTVARAVELVVVPGSDRDKLSVRLSDGAARRVL